MPNPTPREPPPAEIRLDFLPVYLRLSLCQICLSCLLDMTDVAAPESNKTLMMTPGSSISSISTYVLLNSLAVSLSLFTATLLLLTAATTCLVLLAVALAGFSASTSVTIVTAVPTMDVTAP